MKKKWVEGQCSIQISLLMFLWAVLHPSPNAFPRPCLSMSIFRIHFSMFYTSHKTYISFPLKMLKYDEFSPYLKLNHKFKEFSIITNYSPSLLFYDYCTTNLLLLITNLKCTLYCARASRVFLFTPRSCR